MKKIFQMFVIFLLVFSMVGCGVFREGVRPSRPGIGEATKGDDGQYDQDAFTVTLRNDGAAYSPETEMYAQWTDGFSYYTAKFDENGVAAVVGLDGDYRVTLTGVPNGYTYNTNGYVATNDERNLVIDLQKIIRTNKGGTNLYDDIITLETLGVYQTQLESAEDVVYYQFRPTESGTYWIESWVNIAEDSINPKMQVYNGSFVFKTYAYTLDDGGPASASGYTKNFRYEIKIDQSEIGSVFAFGVQAETKGGEYPVTVDFAVTLKGSFSRDHTTGNLIVPQEEFTRAPEGKGGFVGAEFPVEGAPGRYFFDQQMYKLWPKDEGGDGYFHLYDEEKYAQYGGYGPTLYAKISQPCRFIDFAFDSIEYAGNKALTVSDGTENYKLFIEGYAALIVDPPSPALGPYFCNSECPCYSSGTNQGSCPEGCPNCLSTCRHCPEEAVNAPGYAEYCNSDGCYPVTQELKDFLQKFSISQLYFRDGNGWVEENPIIKVDADEESQWLFACGYYLDDPGGNCRD